MTESSRTADNQKYSSLQISHYILLNPLIQLGQQLANKMKPIIITVSPNILKMPTVYHTTAFQVHKCDHITEPLDVPVL